jgi:hypothetical protein
MQAKISKQVLPQDVYPQLLMRFFSFCDFFVAYALKNCEKTIMLQMSISRNSLKTHVF